MFKRKEHVMPLASRVLSNGIIIEAIPSAGDLWSISVKIPHPLEEYYAIYSSEEAQALVSLLSKKYSTFDLFLSQFINN
ncbi:MAG: hypothetical protein II845_02195 [Oscillospiraceae bacterium]|nr:hypothetical protein [Oscillospiraceae bacterium]